MQPYFEDYLLNLKELHNDILNHALKHTAIHLGHLQLMRQMWKLYGREAK